MFQLKSSPQTIAGIIGDTFSLLRRTWLPNLGILIPYLIIISIISYVSEWFFKSQLGSQVSPAQQVSNWMTMMHHSYLLWVVSILHLIITYVAFGALLRASWNRATSNSVSLGNAYAMGFKKLYIYFSKFVVLTVYSAVTIWLIVLLIHKDLFWLSVIVSVILMLGYYYIYVKLLLVETVAMVDDCGLGAAFARSWRSVKGNMWRTAGNVLIANLVYLLLVFVIPLVILYLAVSLFLVPSFIKILNGSTGLGHVLLSLSWVRGLFLFVIAIVGIGYVLSFLSAFTANLVLFYHDLKLRHGNVENDD